LVGLHLHLLQIEFRRCRLHPRLLPKLSLAVARRLHRHLRKLQKNLKLKMLFHLHHYLRLMILQDQLLKPRRLHRHQNFLHLQRHFHLQNLLLENKNLRYLPLLLCCYKFLHHPNHLSPLFVR
jgi:hypothetical protein